MPPRKRKVKQDVIESDDTYGTAAPMSRPAPRKKSRTVESTRAPALDEYDDDLGRRDSREFLEWGMWAQQVRSDEAKRVNNFIKRFGDEMQSTHSEIMEELNKAQATIARKDDTLVEAVAKEFKDDRANIVTGKTHPLFIQGSEILASCHRVLDHHKQVDTCLQGQPIHLPDQLWKEDGRLIKELIGYGRQYAEALVQHIVVPNKPSHGRAGGRSGINALDIDESKLTEPGLIAIDLFRDSKKSARKQTWVQTANSQLEAVSILVKTMKNEI